MNKITILTPVHIGSGQKLGKVDTVFDKNILYVIDVDKVIEILQDNKKALNEFGQSGFNMKDFLDRYNIKYSDVQKYRITSVNFHPREISEFLKTGLGDPIIPGSSIKGAIRTVFLWHLVKENPDKVKERLDEIERNPKVKKENADKVLDDYIFGDTPNKDLMRVLQVGDSKFKIQDIEIKETKILTTSRYVWKTFTSFIECIRKNSPSEFDIKIDKFLLENILAIKELKFNTKEQYFTQLAKKCNEYAGEFIKNEIKFFEKCDMKELKIFYKDLQNKIPKDDKSFLLHLGWGSGWRGMTGNYLDDYYLQRFRKKFNLGKREVPIFPKTRKVIFESSDSVYPTGWIKIEVQ